MLPYLHLERFSLTRRRAITRCGNCSACLKRKVSPDIFGIKILVHHLPLLLQDLVLAQRLPSVLQQENKFFGQIVSHWNE